MRKSLVINADDFGLSPGVDRGILELMHAGIVTSTSVIAERKPPEIPAAIRDRVGLHLRLTDGESLLRRSQIPSLVSDLGRFPRGRPPLSTFSPEASEVGEEWRAQICSFMRSTGGRCTHFDTHHHVHESPAVFFIYLHLCMEFQVAAVPLNDSQAALIRQVGLRCADAVIPVPLPPYHMPATTARILRGAFVDGGIEARGVIWAYSHPGYVDKVLSERSAMCGGRQSELDSMLHPAFREGLKVAGIDLIGACSL